MSGRPALMAGVLLVIFSGLTIAAQLLDYDGKHFGAQSVIGSLVSGIKLAHITDITARGDEIPRHLGLVLPDDARVFVPGMTGSTNGGRCGYYFYLSYYLFPREVAVTLDKPRFTPDGIQGRSTDSDEEMQRHGFDVRVDLSPAGKTLVSGPRVASLGDPVNPAWFNSWPDTLKAGLLPLLTALSGMWLLRLLFFQGLLFRMPMAEQLSCGLALGMMAVGALTLGAKLCGFHAIDWVLLLTSAGAIFELWRDRRVLGREMAAALRMMTASPVVAALLVTGAVIFLILFRLAGLQGIIEFDAVADWLFKAKLFFLGTGRQILEWCANPRLSYANMDYPALVPALHAATYDSLGHVDEFVTKFWPVWMLLFLLLALASPGRGGNSRSRVRLFFLLGLLLLPATQHYVGMEGATLPMVFFTTLGFVQCTIGLEEQSRARLGLGLTLLFGAAMAKFEGAVFLALAAGWLLLLPQGRLLLKPSIRIGRTLAFCFLSALPFLCLRAQIHVQHFDSGWANYALAQPGITFSNAPKLFLMILARQFLDSAFAKWNAPDGQIHWCGHWNGGASLYNHLTIGLPWFCLLLTGLLWVATPARRPAILWTLAVFMSALFTFSVIFASYVSLRGLDQVITEWTPDDAAGRYLFPLLFAWAAVTVTLIFRDPTSSASTTNDNLLTANSPAVGQAREP